MLVGCFKDVHRSRCRQGGSAEALLWPLDDLNEKWGGQKLVHIILPSFCIREAPSNERRTWRAECTDIYFVQGTAHTR